MNVTSLTLPFHGVAGHSHPSGCNVACKNPHLQATAIARLSKMRIPADILRAALEDEQRAHVRGETSDVLTPEGHKTLEKWGATPDEVRSVEGESGSAPPVLDYFEKNRRRSAAYRAGLPDDERRARAARDSRAYRERQRARREAGGGQGTPLG